MDPIEGGGLLPRRLLLFRSLRFHAALPPTGSPRGAVVRPIWRLVGGAIFGTRAGRAVVGVVIAGRTVVGVDIAGRTVVGVDIAGRAVVGVVVAGRAVVGVVVAGRAVRATARATPPRTAARCALVTGPLAITIGTGFAIA
jgi:hypothetical protein